SLGGQAGGGGVYVLDGTITIGESTFASNKTVGGESYIYRFGQYVGGEGNGAGCLLKNGTAMITNCTFSGNIARGGITGNSSVAPILPGGAAWGGGVFISSNQASVVNCTFFGNQVLGGLSLDGVFVTSTGRDG